MSTVCSARAARHRLHRLGNDGFRRNDRPDVRVRTLDSAKADRRHPAYGSEQGRARPSDEAEVCVSRTAERTPGRVGE